jgi:hypothetical protein
MMAEDTIRTNEVMAFPSKKPNPFDTTASSGQSSPDQPARPVKKNPKKSNKLAIILQGLKAAK